MFLDKPPWFQSDAGPTAPIMGLDVHPKGGRLITCGAGITIWNLRPVLDPAAADSPDVSKQLAHISDHEGAVNAVRFSHDGTYFASGADDGCVFIYELRPGKGRGALGSSRVDLENWRIKCKLLSHTINVSDVAWAPGDQLLASASFDNKVLIWDVSQKHPHPIATLEHEGFAKGVAWDPLGKYLASMGEDGLHVWDARSWRLLHFMDEPFKVSSKQNYHLRPDWTVDGAQLVVPNATCLGTRRPIALILSRDGFQAQSNSFVGHDKPVWAVRAGPKMLHVPLALRKNRNMDDARGGDQGPGAQAAAEMATVIAVCSGDNGCTVWTDVLPRPLVAVQGLFQRGVTDAAWTPDGRNLLVASLDGTVAVCRFAAEELGQPLTDQEFANLLQDTYGDLAADVKPLLEDAASLTLLQQAQRPQAQQQQQQQQVGGARRITPVAADAAGLAVASGAAGAGGQLGGRLPLGASALDARIMPQGAAVVTTLAAPRKQLQPAPAAATPTKRQAVATAGTGKPGRAPAKATPDKAAGSSSSSRAAAGQSLLPEPRVLPVMEVGLGRVGREVLLPEGQLVLHVKNSSSGPAGPVAELQMRLERQVVWEDTVEGQVVAAAGSGMFCAVALQGGQLLLYSQRGRRMLGALALGSTPVHLSSQGLWHLLVITVDGKLKVFNLQKIQRDSEVSLAPILPPGTSVVDIWLGGTGPGQCMPLVLLSNGTGWGWYHQLREWVQMADVRRQITPHNDAMQHPEGDMGRLFRGIRPALGNLLDEPLADAQLLSRRTRAGFEEWLATAHMLGAGQSARVALGLYVQQLVLSLDQGRLIELVQDLLGPVRRQPGHPWDPQLCGISKWELLRTEVLPKMTGNPKLESNRRLILQQLEEAERWQQQLQQQPSQQQATDKVRLSWLPPAQEEDAQVSDVAGRAGSGQLV